MTCGESRGGSSIPTAGGKLGQARTKRTLHATPRGFGEEKAKQRSQKYCKEEKQTTLMRNSAGGRGHLLNNYDKNKREGGIYIQDLLWR